MSNALKGMRIGIDFDNTIADYQDVFAKVAVALDILPSGFQGNKGAVKEACLEIYGEQAWMRVQGRVYGEYMPLAKVYEGALSFFSECISQDADLVIVSHKTKFGHFDPNNVNLRDAARQWINEKGINKFIPQEKTYFHETRLEKIQKISDLKCDVFIDDLPEVLSDKEFPDRAVKILFGASTVDTEEAYACPIWHEMMKVVTDAVR